MGRCARFIAVLDAICPDLAEDKMPKIRHRLSLSPNPGLVHTSMIKYESCVYMCIESYIDTVSSQLYMRLTLRVSPSCGKRSLRVQRFWGLSARACSLSFGFRFVANQVSTSY